MIEKLNERITIAKKNISKTAQKIFLLTNSNFEKESKENNSNNPNNLNKKNITNSRYKNFGKVKRKRLGTTYIFFGAKFTESTNNRSSSPNFLYVCFEDKGKVFYYVKNKLNERKQLFEFPYIYPLEDLISFILLRRIITEDKNFANIIYEEAKKRIKFLKTQKFSDKIIKNKNPYNFQVTSQGLIQSKNLNERHNNHSIKGPNQDKSHTLIPTSLLPISPELIQVV